MFTAYGAITTLLRIWNCLNRDHEKCSTEVRLTRNHWQPIVCAGVQLVEKGGLLRIVRGHQLVCKAHCALSNKFGGIIVVDRRSPTWAISPTTVGGPLCFCAFRSQTLIVRCTRAALQVYLHVDLTYYPAVRMYETMGYELVNDLEVSFEVRATCVS